MVNSENTGVKDVESPTSQEVQFEDVTTKWHGSRLHVNKRIVTLVKMPRFEGKQVTIFPKKFPVPVVCSEFCGKVENCKLRENGFSDLCKYHHKLGKLVMPVDLKWSVRFNMKKDQELKARMQFAKSAISGIIPEIALAHERTEDSTFAAYSSQEFLDTYDDPEDGHELEYTMDTGMVSPDKSQAGFVPSFIYRTTYREKRILLGFENRRVQRVYSEIERMWFIQNGKPVYAEVEVPKVTEYTESMPVYKWIRLPTLRPIGCYLKPVKVIGSTTILTRREQKFYNDRREVERQKRVQYRSLINMDEMAARAEVPLLVVNPGR